MYVAPIRTWKYWYSINKDYLYQYIAVCCSSIVIFERAEALLLLNTVNICNCQIITAYATIAVFGPANTQLVVRNFTYGMHQLPYIAMPAKVLCQLSGKQTHY